ncbi:uncharacterized protein LOC110106394 [Dendrobium catenatum]|uniref:uncharacterized protein LOC110106394 n=1 Tax=Dendrobium catenatum TaxID=906689 RepID=UPI0009F6F654|nr:uncharacterized protein LOC110106394 [Dendrobium catenatum]
MSAEYLALQKQGPGHLSRPRGINLYWAAVGHLKRSSFLTARFIVSRPGFDNSKPAPTPISHKSLSPAPDDQPFPDPQHYQRLAGSLQYLTITRPDIAFATNVICQKMHNPLNSDYHSLKCLLRYIQGTLHYGLPITKGDLQLSTYTDTNWAADPSDRKLVTRFCTFLGTTLISWCVKKQVTVAKSSTEAEYRSLASVVSYVLWFQRLVAEFQIPQSSPTTIFCDNTSAIALANNPVFHARTKHIEIDYHFISEHIHRQAIAIAHIATADQTAYILTKSLLPPRFQELRAKLTIRPPTGQFEGG